MSLSGAGLGCEFAAEKGCVDSMPDEVEGRDGARMMDDERETIPDRDDNGGSGWTMTLPLATASLTTANLPLSSRGWQRGRERSMGEMWSFP